ncbi:MAG: hypothetical protein MJZ20_02905 [Bacteroidaceae bacterium]|nr:hypothetical protein [Bacteroidaceae bacterium]
MKHVYTNWATSIFDGFYESDLYNSDTELRLTEYMDDGHEYEIKDFDGYTREIASKAVELLSDYVSDCNIKIESLNGLDMPRFYNYRTDRLDINTDVDLDALKAYAFNEHRAEFDAYLHENWTSCSGFISFIEDNVHDFERNFEHNTDNNTDILIEFYILSHLDVDAYKQDLYESALDLQMRYAEPTSEDVEK